MSPIFPGIDGGDVLLDEGNQGGIGRRHFDGAFHWFGIDGGDLAVGVLVHERHGRGFSDLVPMGDSLNRGPPGLYQNFGEAADGA